VNQLPYVRRWTYNLDFVRIGGCRRHHEKSSSTRTVQSLSFRPHGRFSRSISIDLKARNMVDALIEKKRKHEDSNEASSSRKSTPPVGYTCNLCQQEGHWIQRESRNHECLLHDFIKKFVLKCLTRAIPFLTILPQNVRTEERSTAVSNKRIRFIFQSLA